MDPITRAALDTLQNEYGIPAAHIKNITVHSAHDDLTQVTVTLILRNSGPVRMRDRDDTVSVPLIRPPMRPDVPRTHGDAPTERIGFPFTGCVGDPCVLDHVHHRV